MQHHFENGNHIYTGSLGTDKAGIMNEQIFRIDFKNLKMSIKGSRSFKDFSSINCYSSKQLITSESAIIDFFYAFIYPDLSTFSPIHL